MLEYKLLSEDLQEAGIYLLELIRAALSETKAAEKPETVSWSQVYWMAGYHKVEAMSAFALKTLLRPPEEELLKKWQEKINQTLFRELHFGLERELIYKEMETHGISYLPLKGILLTGYYPKAGMRTMADNDILYGFVEKADNHEYKISGNNDAECEFAVTQAQSVMVQIMNELGYYAGSLSGNHDSFYKKPFYNFEMHRKLVSSLSQQAEYYKNPWKRAKPDSESKFGYHFTNEDEYLFLLVHAFKHFDGQGCGIRILCDIYAFLKKKGNTLNWEYVKQELKVLKIEDFERDLRDLANAIFVEQRKLSNEEDVFLHFLLCSGLYGREEIRIKQKIHKLEKHGANSRLKARILYIKERAFLDEQMVKEVFPYFYKKPYVMLFLLVYRVIKGMVKHPGKLFKEWKYIWER